MSVETSYTKSITSDFPSSKVNISTIATIIKGSSITITLVRVDTDGDLCIFVFEDVLLTSDIETLNTIISLHKGDPSPKAVQNVKILEENVATGGHFSIKSFKITTNASDTNSLKIFWPYPISALKMIFPIKESQINDHISMTIAEDTIYGTLIEDISGIPVTWSQNTFVKGNSVLYTTSDYGERVYTCIVDTTDQSPESATDWVHGFEIKATVETLSNIFIGHKVKIDDSTNINDIGFVISKGDNSFFVSKHPVNSFAISTYIKMLIYVVDDYCFNISGIHEIGTGKIGGSYIPANVIITLTYNNKQVSNDTLVGSLEYLY